MRITDPAGEIQGGQDADWFTQEVTHYRDEATRYRQEADFWRALFTELKALVREFLRESFNPSTPGNDERWLQLGEQLERNSMNNPFKIEVDPPSGDEIAGKVRIAFTVPYLWFAFHRPMWILGPRKQSEQEKEREKRRVAQHFGDMITEEILRCWPKDKELEK